MSSPYVYYMVSGGGSEPKPREPKSKAQKIIDSILILGIVVMLVALGFVGYWVGTSSNHEDPFYANCDRHNGVVATQEHGKTESYYCIVGNQVIDTED